VILATDGEAYCSPDAEHLVEWDQCADALWPHILTKSRQQLLHRSGVKYSTIGLPILADLLEYWMSVFPKFRAVLVPKVQTDVR